MLAKEKFGIRGRDVSELDAQFIPFTAQTRMSGVEFGNSPFAKARSTPFWMISGLLPASLLRAR